MSFESSPHLVDGNRLTGQRNQEAEEVRTLTFTELRSLIEQGKTDGIPNNKLIPDVLNVSPSPSSRHTVSALSLGCFRTLLPARIPDRSERNPGKRNSVSNSD